MVGKLACSVTQGRRVVRLTPALLNQYNELHKTPSNGQSPAGLTLEASALVHSSRASLHRPLDACCRGVACPSAEAEVEIVGCVVQPLARVLADVSVTPVDHHAKHIALDDLRLDGGLELRVYVSGEVSAAPVALAVVSEEAVRDLAGPAVTELKVKGVAACAGRHHPDAWTDRLLVVQLLARGGRQSQAAAVGTGVAAAVHLQPGCVPEGRGPRE